MRLSTKGRYAITAMLDLALNAQDGHKVTLADISEFQGISLSYLEQLFARLRQAKLVQGTRGPGGGYRLARPAHEISITDIVIAVDDKFDQGTPLSQIDVRHQKTQELWDLLSNQIQDYLNGVTLGALVDHEKGASPSVATDHKQGQESWSEVVPKQSTYRNL
jgi:Rrf2 family iron-sulfur cluster assembly transcriptional regulator